MKPAMAWSPRRCSVTSRECSTACVCVRGEERSERPAVHAHERKKAQETTAEGDLGITSSDLAAKAGVPNLENDCVAKAINYKATQKSRAVAVKPADAQRTANAPHGGAHGCLKNGKWPKVAQQG